MAYGLKYYSEFDSLQSIGYRVEIAEKDYTGASTELLAAGTPLIHKWNTDDPFAAVKGSSINFTYINTGAFPLELFAGNDDTYRLIVKQGAKVLFVGYIVQDDCSEIQVDYEHEVTINATDNLGLLKDISLSEAAEKAAEITTAMYYVATTPNSLLGDVTSFNIGDLLTFTIGSTVYNATVTYTYNVFGVNYAEVNIVLPTTSLTNISITRKRTVNLKSKNSIGAILKLCLLATGSELYTNFLTTLFEVNGQTGRILEDVLIDTKTFLNNDTYDNCYNVLEQILGRFMFSLIQAEGEWQITNLHENAMHMGKYVGHRYDSHFAYVGSTDFYRDFTYGNGSDIETGFLKKLERPYKYQKDSFDYKQPEKLLKNADLKELGPLIREYSTGSGTSLVTTKEYVAVGWKLGWWWNSTNTQIVNNTGMELFIRVITDYKNNEKERYLVLKGAYGSWGNAKPFIANENIECTKDDKIEFSLSYRTNFSYTPVASALILVTNPIVLVDALPLTPGSYYLLEQKGTWKKQNVTAQIYDTISGADFGDYGDWHTYERVSIEMPTDGLMYIFPAHEGDTSHCDETHFKNISFKYITQIAGQQNVKGHIHKSEQDLAIKNKDERNITIDDAPSNSMSGCLYLSTMGPITQNRTWQWKRYTGDAIAKRLGDIISLNVMNLKRYPRSRYEGTLLNTKQNGLNLSPLAIIDYQHSFAKKYVVGTLEINYKADTANSVTLWELYSEADINNPYTGVYSFTYMYDS